MSRRRPDTPAVKALVARFDTLVAANAAPSVIEAQADAIDRARGRKPPAVDPLVRQFDRRLDTATTMADADALLRIARVIRKRDAAAVRRRRNAARLSHASRVTERRAHLCPGINPESKFRGQVTFLGDSDTSTPCTGCGQTFPRVPL